MFNDIARVMSNMASGELNLLIEKQYTGTFGEVKDDINKTIENLSSVLSNMKTAADGIHETSNEISQGNSSLSSCTEQQSANLEETAASMEQSRCASSLLSSRLEKKALPYKQARVLK